MKDKFQNKYRIPSARLQSWEYGNAGSYFITICTHHRKHYFGKKINGEMFLNDVGELVEKYWNEIPDHFLFIRLGNFVVMPNHVHGILIIDKPLVDDVTVSAGASALAVEMRLSASLQNGVQGISQPITKPGGITGEKNPMFHKNISRIVRHYKGQCSFEIRKTRSGFAWQPRFYDIIICNAGSFERIQDYIANNPKNWKGDLINESLLILFISVDLRLLGS